MIIPDCPPCDIRSLDPVATVLLTCAFGVLGLAVIVLALKGWDVFLSIRARRIDTLHRRGPC